MHSWKPQFTGVIRQTGIGHSLDTSSVFTAIHFFIFKGKIKFYSCRQWLCEVTLKIDQPNLDVATGSCVCSHAHSTHLQKVTLMKVRCLHWRDLMIHMIWRKWMRLHDIDLWCRWILISCIWRIWNRKSRGLLYLMCSHQGLSDRNCLRVLLIVKWEIDWNHWLDVSFIYLPLNYKIRSRKKYASNKCRSKK